MSTHNAALHVERVNVSFGGLRALNDVYLEVGKNEVVGLIGPNGAGKTTLFNALCGLVTPDSGEFHLNGKKSVVSNNNICSLSFAFSICCKAL
jgi:branched-chain amino acid transport system ATP-binding protein